MKLSKDSQKNQFINTATITCLMCVWSYVYTSDIDHVQGKLDLGESPFFRIRLDGADEEFLLRLSKAFSATGQIIQRDRSTNSTMKFAVSRKSFTGNAVKLALQQAAGMSWDQCGVRIYIHNMGAKMCLTEYCEKARTAHQAHIDEVGMMNADRFAEHAVVDVGLDMKTNGFLAITSTARTQTVAGSAARITDTSQWGKLGKNFGGVMASNLSAGFSKFIVYNKAVSALRSSVHGLKLKNSAVHRAATQRWMHEKFKPLVADGIEVLHPDNSEDVVRIELRSTTSEAFGADSWRICCMNKINDLAATLLAVDADRVAVHNQAQTAFQNADAAGLFSCNYHSTAEHRIQKWKYHQGNRLAYLIGFNHTHTDALSHDLELKGKGWGNIFNYIEEVEAPYRISLQIGYTLAQDYEAWVPGGDLKGAALAAAAHEAAGSINWRAATGEPEDDYPVAQTLQEIALYVRWRLIARGRKLTATKANNGNCMEAFGQSLEEAALKILASKVPLSTMVKFRQGS